jgi:orotidine-5'-phosphate decarboxylase
MTAPRAPFGERLHDAVSRRGHLCVGIDPSSEALAAWGLSDTADGAETFASAIVAAAKDNVAVIKPQTAFFERFGPDGIRVLQAVCRTARREGLLVLLDAKRGDIGSTSRAYAQAYLLPDSPIAVDAMTVTPYVGVGALGPFFEAATASGTGLFVLARTSNREGAELQDSVSATGKTVTGAVIDEVRRRNAGSGHGSFGLVYGATVEARLPGDPRGFILAPGLGPQGGNPEDLAGRFGELSGRVIPAASRLIAAAGPGEFALRRTIRVLNERCTTVLRQREK